MSDSDRLDRIEAALENQVQVNAELRTAVEVLRNTVESERQANTDLRGATEASLQTVQLHQYNIEVLTQVLCRHLSDGHGGTNNQ